MISMIVLLLFVSGATYVCAQFPVKGQIAMIISLAFLGFLVLLSIFLSVVFPVEFNLP